MGNAQISMKIALESIAYRFETGAPTSPGLSAPMGYGMHESDSLAPWEGLRFFRRAGRKRWRVRWRLAIFGLRGTRKG